MDEEIFRVQITIKLCSELLIDFCLSFSPVPFYTKVRLVKYFQLKKASQIPSRPYISQKTWILKTHLKNEIEILRMTANQKIN